MKSVYSDEYTIFLRLVLEERKAAGLTQKQLADRLGKPQSFVSKYERGERRLDIAEFLAVMRAMNADPHGIINAMQGEEDRETADE